MCIGVPSSSLYIGLLQLGLQLVAAENETKCFLHGWKCDASPTFPIRKIFGQGFALLRKALHFSSQAKVCRDLLLICRYRTDADATSTAAGADAILKDAASQVKPSHHALPHHLDDGSTLNDQNTLPQDSDCQSCRTHPRHQRCQGCCQYMQFF